MNRARPCLWSCLGIWLLAGSSPARAQESGSYFPLEDGTLWTYTLHITRDGESQDVPYTVRVARHEDLGGSSCAVLETRVGDSLLETTWFAWEGKKLRNPRRESRRAALELQEAPPAGDPGSGPRPGRVVLDLEAIPAPAAEPPVAPEGQPPERPAGPSWAWQSPDGQAEGVIRFVRREKLQVGQLGELDCLVLVEASRFRVGQKQARQERRWWLAPGLGLVQEISRIEVDGGQASETRAVLERKPERS